MLERDLQEKLQTTERKRLETRIREQEVALTRTRIAERNQKAAQLKKEEVCNYQLMVLGLDLKICLKISSFSSPDCSTHAKICRKAAAGGKGIKGFGATSGRRSQ